MELARPLGLFHPEAIPLSVLLVTFPTWEK